MISVVIPTLDEAAVLPGRLAALAEEEEPHEVIVADGGSEDATCEAAAAGGARVLASPRGRARQLNAGAAAARGDLLLFLHADVALPRGALAAVRRAAADPEVVAGGFLKRYDGGGAALAAAAALANTWRTRLGRRLVGSQAPFVRRDAFERLGGFRDWPLLEDVELLDRLRDRGRIAVVPLTVTASARRYLRRGVLRQLAVNAVVLAAYRLGVGPEALERLYRGGR